MKEILSKDSVCIIYFVFFDNHKWSWNSISFCLNILKIFFFFYADLIKLFHVVHRISSNWFFLFFTLGQVCHHTDCQSQNKMNPIALCIDCDQHNHQHGEFATHLRFDLAKTSTINLHRKTSIRSNNSDSGTEDDNDPAYSL